MTMSIDTDRYNNIPSYSLSSSTIKSTNGSFVKPQRAYSWQIKRTFFVTINEKQRWYKVWPFSLLFTVIWFLFLWQDVMLIANYLWNNARFGFSLTHACSPVLVSSWISEIESWYLGPTIWTCMVVFRHSWLTFNENLSKSLLNVTPCPMRSIWVCLPRSFLIWNLLDFQAPMPRLVNAAEIDSSDFSLHLKRYHSPQWYLLELTFIFRTCLSQAYSYRVIGTDLGVT